MSLSPELGAPLPFLLCGPETAGLRLDRALAAILPHMGLRGRRRAIDDGRVLVNGQPGSAAQHVRRGDRVVVRPVRDRNDVCGTDTARVLARQGAYWFLYKPPGQHSVTLAGGTARGLDAFLSEYLGKNFDLPGQGRASILPVLLQRLDRGTSGIVCAAGTEAAAQAFRQAERAGRCEKRYLALVEGHLATPTVVRHALQTAHRRRSRVLPSLAESLRWTELWPLHFWTPAALKRLWPHLNVPSGATLAACRIRCGARHQIRAHAAFLGHPLVGDADYGASCPLDGSPPLYLHHGGLSFPGASCAILPAWMPLLEGEPHLGAVVHDWLFFRGVVNCGHKNSASFPSS